MEIITGGARTYVYGVAERLPVPAGYVAIIGDRGDLLCICKNDVELIKLSIFSHGEEDL